MWVWHILARAYYLFSVFFGEDLDRRLVCGVSWIGWVRGVGEISWVKIGRDGADVGWEGGIYVLGMERERWEVGCCE